MLRRGRGSASGLSTEGQLPKEQTRNRPLYLWMRSPDLPNCGGLSRSLPSVGTRPSACSASTNTSSPTSAGMLSRPWQAYNACDRVPARVIDKLLFGSDFRTPRERLHRGALQHQPDRSGPTCPSCSRGAAWHRVERDAIGLLGLMSEIFRITTEDTELHESTEGETVVSRRSGRRESVAL